MFNFAEGEVPSKPGASRKRVVAGHQPEAPPESTRKRAKQADAGGEERGDKCVYRYVPHMV